MMMMMVMRIVFSIIDQIMEDLCCDDDSNGNDDDDNDDDNFLCVSDESMEELYAKGEGPIFKESMVWLKSSNPQLQMSGALAIGNFARNGEESRISCLYNIYYDVHWPKTDIIPDSKVYGPNMGPTSGRQGPGGPHVGPMDLAIWDIMKYVVDVSLMSVIYWNSLWWVIKHQAELWCLPKI